MTGYRVCLDCYRKIPAGGDAEHRIDDEVLIGCEGYRHKEGEGQAVQLGISASKVTAVARRITEEYYKDCEGEPSEDYADAFSYLGDLFDYVSAEMLYQIYKNDSPEFEAEFRIRVAIAEMNAEAAVSGLIPFGITVEDWK